MEAFLWLSSSNLFRRWTVSTTLVGAGVLDDGGAAACNPGAVARSRPILLTTAPSLPLKLKLGASTPVDDTDEEVARSADDDFSREYRPATVLA